MKLYTTVGIVLTLGCNAECDICCFSCSPSRLNETIDETFLKRILAELSECPEILEVNFTGGEPFLHLNLLETAIDSAYKAGKNVGVITNGFWCSDYSSTYELLMLYKKLGLSSISVSYDPYHSKYIEASCIDNLLLAAKSIHLPCSLNITGYKENISDLHSTLEMLNPNALNRTSIQYNRGMLAGRAKNYFPPDNIGSTQVPEKLHCGFSRVLSVFPDGSIFPCCSYHLTSLPFKSYKLITQTISDVLSDIYREDPFAYILTCPQLLYQGEC